ncbi:MAG: thermonuclease family protein [Coriobacteriales bacterium]|nr:thermonuclease family protein [Coriobacteriales bacterium]
MISAKSKQSMVGALMAALLLAVISLSACLQLPGFEGDPGLGLERVTVIQVADGDTLVIEHEGGGQDRVRLIGIDCPEYNTPEGKDAATYVRMLLPEGSSVWLQKDVSEVDRYGRLLRYVWIEQPANTGDDEARAKMLNALLLENGHAIARGYEPDTRYELLFAQLDAGKEPSDAERLLEEALELTRED